MFGNKLKVVVPFGILSVVLVAIAPAFLPAQKSGPDGAAAGAEVERPHEIIFSPVKIDGPAQDPANHSYWFGPFAEAVAVFDINGDGRLDIACGKNWYENMGRSGPPGFETVKWVKHANYREDADVFGPITDDGGEAALDVNHDGKPDLIASGWLKMSGIYWYENPGNTGQQWKGHLIHKARNMEGFVMGDIAGHHNGDQDILVDHWDPVEGQFFTWYEHIDKEPWFVEHVLGTEGQSHGNGIGDIAGHGRNDLVTGTGWWEAPADPRNDKQWIWHPDWNLFRGNCALPVLVYDCNGDGLNDLIIGAAQDYGLKWLEQKKDSSGKRTFVEHWIERDFSLFHTMELGDLRGDGKKELVTGKILFPHQGRDPVTFNPLFAFWYDIGGGEFYRHILSFNHMQWYPEATDNPPPNGAIGVGRKLAIVDVDGDGKKEIVVSSNSGLYIFYNRGTEPSGRIAKDPLPPNNTYPNNYNRPFGGRGRGQGQGPGQPDEKGTGRGPAPPGGN
jgi:hypothetical protein